MPWTADRRLFLTADDKVVEDGDPAGVKLLVGAEGVVDDETAKKYGLKHKAKAEPAAADADAPAEVDTKAVKTAPANKAKAAAPEDK